MSAKRSDKQKKNAVKSQIQIQNYIFHKTPQIKLPVLVDKNNLRYTTSFRHRKLGNGELSSKTIAFYTVAD